MHRTTFCSHLFACYFCWDETCPSFVFGYQNNNSNRLKIKCNSIPKYLYELRVLFGDP